MTTLDGYSGILGPFFAPAKINLSLQITGRRHDGYHLLHSLVAFTHLSDALWLELSDSMSLQVEGPFAEQVPADDTNLVWRAGQQVLDTLGLQGGVACRLLKNLPTGAGLGGGSADAACVLRELPTALARELGTAQLHDLALALGADVPVCLESQPRIMSGIGDVLSVPVQLPTLSVVLVNPGMALSTPDVFSAYRSSGRNFSHVETDPTALNTLSTLISYLDGTGNDLTDAAVNLCPEIGDVMAALMRQNGALVSRMTGSGATCFALFEDANLAGQAVRQIEADHPTWWVVDTLLADGATAA